MTQHRTTRSGFTVLEAMITVTLLAMVLGSVGVVVMSGSGAYFEGAARGNLETRARRAIDVIAAEFGDASLAGLLPMPVEPLGSETLTYQRSAGAGGGGGAAVVNRRGAADGTAAPAAGGINRRNHRPSYRGDYNRAGGAVVKPRSAFQYFAKGGPGSAREAVAKANAEAKDGRAMSKELRRRWKALGESARAPFEAKAKLDKLRYAKESGKGVGDRHQEI